MPAIHLRECFVEGDSVLPFCDVNVCYREIPVCGLPGFDDFISGRIGSPCRYPKFGVYDKGRDFLIAQLGAYFVSNRAVIAVYGIAFLGTGDVGRQYDKLDGSVFGLLCDFEALRGRSYYIAGGLEASRLYADASCARLFRIVFADGYGYLCVACP